MEKRLEKINKAEKFLSQVSIYPNKEVVDAYTYLKNLANSNVKYYSQYAQECLIKIEDI